MSFPRCPFCKTRDEVEEEKYLVFSPVRSPMAMVLFSSIATFACAYFAFTPVETAGFAALSILPAVIYFRQRWYCSRCELEFTAPSNEQNTPKGVKDTVI